MGTVGEVIDEMSQMGEPGEIRDDGAVHLELQVWDHRGEIAIPDPFSVAVHRPLNLGRPGEDGGEGVRHAHAGVVVGVDADDTTRARLAGMPRRPSSDGRFRSHDLSLFRPDQLAAIDRLWGPPGDRADSDAGGVR